MSGCCRITYEHTKKSHPATQDDDENDKEKKKQATPI
jgi:hypothetical protein